MSDYAYDSLYRITSATITGNNDATKNYTENYTYDPIGNILTKTLNGVNTNYTYAGNTGASFANPHAVTQIGDQTFSYDQNGNLISDGTSTYAFNPKNQLIKVTKGTTVINYTYDSIGQRISKSQGASFTLYPNKSYNVDSMGKTTVSIFAPWGMVANIETLPDSVPKVYTFATDHLGGVAVTTDSAGVPVEIQDYGTFGNSGLNDKSETFDSQRKYIGEMYDTETELNYLNARYYNSAIGRFISEDPMFWSLPKELLVDPQQQNSYAYARNNPIGLSDPSGLIPTAKEAAQMATQIYQDGNEGKNLSGRWQYNSLLSGDGTKTGIYSRVKEDKNIEYALVGRGTSNLSDWINNFQQPFNRSPDMSTSIDRATDFVNKNKDNEITFVGHSKAGAEAMADAIKNNKNAIIFNPASLNVSGLNTAGYTAQVNEYIVKGEPINSIFGLVSTTFGSHDSVNYLPAQHSLSLLERLILGPILSSYVGAYNSYQNHSMQSVIKGIK